MAIIKRVRTNLILAIAFLCTHAATFLLMPLASKYAEQTHRISLIVLGSVFWAAMLAGYVFLVIANVHRRQFVRKKLDGDYKMNSRIGALTFFANTPATIADITLFVSIAAFGIMLLFKATENYGTFVMLFLLDLTLNLHCILNGRIYKTTKYRPVRRKKS